MAEFQEEELRQTVIRMYQDLVLKQKILQIRSKTNKLTQNIIHYYHTYINLFKS